MPYICGCRGGWIDTAAKESNPISHMLGGEREYIATDVEKFCLGRGGAGGISHILNVQAAYAISIFRGWKRV